MKSSDIGIKFFWLPKEVIYYVIIPMIVILIVYFTFYLIYRRKKGTYYYNYVVDYVYSTLGILFCGILFCLLLGYSIATMQILIVNRVIARYIILAIILVILPIIPTVFLIYIIKVYFKNLKRKEGLDKDLENYEKEKKLEKNKPQESSGFKEVELVKKNG